ncbi:MAG: DNA/RNA nuclease SfsA, partial [Acidobacteriota bacterium]
MRFDKPILPATLIRRYKRFLADVELADGSTLTVHCPNPGAMTSCSEPGRPVWISDSENPKRKLRYTLEMIRMGRSWVNVNTGSANPAVAGFIRAGKVPELGGYAELQREVKTGDSRIDLRLRDPARA